MYNIKAQRGVLKRLGRPLVRIRFGGLFQVCSLEMLFFKAVCSYSPVPLVARRNVEPVWRPGPFVFRLQLHSGCSKRLLLLLQHVLRHRIVRMDLGFQHVVHVSIVFPSRHWLGSFSQIIQHLLLFCLLLDDACYMTSLAKV